MIYKSNFVNFSFENNLVILGGIVCGDICVIVKATKFYASKESPGQSRPQPRGITL